MFFTKIILIFLIFINQNYAIFPKVIINNFYFDEQFVKSLVSFTPETLSDIRNVINISVTYGEDENGVLLVHKNVYEVKDLPDLRTFVLTNTTQDALPTFKNLDRLQSIEIFANALTFVKRGQISEVPITHLDLSYNDIDSIDAHSFGEKIRTLDLSCNKLTIFNADWLKNPGNLKELHLTGNLIKRLEDNQFKPMVKMDTINLDFNEISSVGIGAFGNRNFYKSINISHNKIRELKAGVFLNDSIKVNNFDMSYLELTFLSEEFLQRTSIGAKISIGENPWQCACWILIKQWIPDGINAVRDQDRPICVTPKGGYQNTSTCVPEVDVELIEIFDTEVKPKPPTGFCSIYRPMKLFDHKRYTLKNLVDTPIYDANSLDFI